MDERYLTDPAMGERNITDQEINKSQKDKQDKGDKVAELVEDLINNIEKIDTLIENERMVESTNIADYRETRMSFMLEAQEILRELDKLFPKTRPGILGRVFGVNKKKLQKIQADTIEYISECEKAIIRINTMIVKLSDIYHRLNTPSPDNIQKPEVIEENKNAREYPHNYSQPRDAAIGTLSQKIPLLSDYYVTAGGKKSKKRRTQSKQTKRRQRKINKKSKIKYTIRRR
jgi:hypothetical protein